MNAAGAATVALSVHPEVVEFRQKRQPSELFETAPNYLDDGKSGRIHGASFKINENGSDSNYYRHFWEGIQHHVNVKQHNLNSYPHHAHDILPHDIFRSGKPNKSCLEIDSMIFDSVGKWKLAWDLFIVALVMYSVVLIPYQIGFDWQQPAGVKMVDYFIDGLFFIDILCTFNTTYEDPVTEEVVTSRTKIAVHYLRFWFWVDICSTIPFDEIVQAMFHSQHQLFATRTVRVLRIMKFSRLYKLSNFEAVIEERLQLSPAKSRLLWLVLQICFIAHIFACFWHFLSLDKFVRPMAPQDWVTANGFSSATNGTRYVAALYYVIVTMLTVGYGDILPTNSHEIAFSIVLIISGGVIFGALIGKVTSILERQNPQRRAFKESMDELRAFLDDYALPDTVKVKVKKA